MKLRRLSTACALGVSILGFVLTPRPPAAHGAGLQGKARQLRVMSYNIKHGQTNADCSAPKPESGRPPQRDCNLDLDASVAVIRAHRPDIIGLQEIDRFWARSGYADEAALLVERTGLPHQCYAANLDHQADAHADRPHQYGTLVLSRFPILECGNTLLPREGEAEQRGLALALIDAGGVRLRFYNTHLHTTAADRVKQTAHILTVLDQATGPAVLVGDFNARPTAPEMAPVFSRFTDAWTKAGVPAEDNPDGLTSPARLAGNPTSRIDYVLVGGQVEAASAHVPIDAQTRHAADHYPVVVTLTLPGSGHGAVRE
jgi:endonuclease/exonuclease/phosphatase family metal-dependent hydrolase